MPHERFFVGPEDVPETVLLKNLALITAMRQSDASWWVAADEHGQAEGTYMVVCVLGPNRIADLQAALQVLTQKWEEDDHDEGIDHPDS
jgi:hypothetical protein